MRMGQEGRESPANSKTKKWNKAGWMNKKPFSLAESRKARIVW